MSESQILTLDNIHQLAKLALLGAGASEQAAQAVAQSTVWAERDGIRSHGLQYVPIYADHIKCGKVVGQAQPIVIQASPSSIRVDAANGFAHPAIDAAWDKFTAAANTQGVAVLTVHNSYNCGVLGHHAKRLAENGYLGLCFTHAPASIAPTGGKQAVIGTNPFAVAVPDGKGGCSLAIDQSASVVAKSEILLRNRLGEPIEPGWAMDENGNETTDAAAALKGSMAPAGGYKGFGVGLLVELMASCLAGAVLSKDASPFAGTAGGPPSTGQCFIAFDINAFSGDAFYAQIEQLINAIEIQEGTHVPGAKAKQHRPITERDGVEVPLSLIEQIRAYHLAE